MGVREPRWVQVEAPAVTLRALRWEPREDGTDAPTALCLHGFPDTAHGWRAVAPKLVDAGWRVVAPFMRGYAPSTIPSDGCYDIGALMDDALRVLNVVGPTGRDVVIGHDWGAMAAWGLAAAPDSPFTKAVVMSVPPVQAFRPQRGLGVRRSLAALLPAQAVRSWYIQYFQLPWLPERSASWVLPLLWRRWSPGFDATEDLRHVDAAHRFTRELEGCTRLLPGHRAAGRSAGALRRAPEAMAGAGEPSCSIPAWRRRRLHDREVRRPRRGRAASRWGAACGRPRGPFPAA